MQRSGLALGGLAAVAGIIIGAVVLSSVFGIGFGGDLLADDDPGDDSAPTDVDASDPGDGPSSNESDSATNESDGTPAISEPAANIPVPEEGDPYFEARDPDGEWVSYVNPRDEYREPYLGAGSGKLCMTLLNADGEPIVGESVPNTTVTVPTGESLSWHSLADPFAVEFPVSDERQPLDADQFGTSSSLAQGDGVMDSHCIEFHGLPEDGTISYGEAEVTGDYADAIDVVGYIQQANDNWDTDVDPIEDAVSYEEAGGAWTYEPGGSHGQAVIVLQLSPDGAEASG
ncbi:hypothetical protein C479_06442 [Halovivax asiaticus JCM 14624]|uniref:Uncharacterized protein n=2 Tax=Halovivax asiaticus TaxID=332953 RepID=M0BMF9_9EURY|nr:hypothetical protein C479_06442 [Halovivax asiaticus JCM 14624]